jgi:hypothetical protein
MRVAASAMGESQLEKRNYDRQQSYMCRLHSYQSHTAKRLFLTYRLKIKNCMSTCFGVFIYAIIRPADMEVNFKFHCAKWDPLHA